MSASSMPNRVVVRAHWWKSEGWKQAAKERKQGTFIIYRDKGDQWSERTLTNNHLSLTEKSLENLIKS